MRALSVSVSLALAALLLGPGCGPEPEGVDDCREIESARCRAAAQCGVIDDVDGCVRFYHDQCLHGLPVDSPGRPAREACVEAIEAAPEADDCAAVLEPERLSACAFLGPSDEPPPEEGEGGSGGAPGEEPSEEPSAGAPSVGAGGSDASEDG